MARSIGTFKISPCACIARLQPVTLLFAALTRVTGLGRSLSFIRINFGPRHSLKTRADRVTSTVCRLALGEGQDGFSWLKDKVIVFLGSTCRLGCRSNSSRAVSNGKMVYDDPPLERKGRCRVRKQACGMAKLFYKQRKRGTGTERGLQELCSVSFLFLVSAGNGQAIPVGAYSLVPVLEVVAGSSLLPVCNLC